MADVAGDAHDRVAGAVVVGMETADVVGRDRADRLAVARRVPPERMAVEDLAGERAHRHVVGRVVVHRQLLEDDLALALDVVVLHQRAGEHVAEQLDAGRRMPQASGSNTPCTPWT